ncbi:hypothetical protein BJ742DRAFT_747641 [Cladochytrium replicatum]|nr:hypothetical protein BJ742DRAFT_747641 [Cladochytrium replicatum]
MFLTRLAIGLFAVPYAFAAVPDIAAPDATNQQVGHWDTVTGAGTGVVCIHTILLPGPDPSGKKWKLMCMERPHVAPYLPNNATGQETTAEVDPWSGTFTTTHVLRNSFCGGHSQMADGSILVIGGDRDTHTVNNVPFTIDGRNARRIYTPIDSLPAGTASPANAAWNLQIGDMAVNRWYPTVLTLATGEHMIISGSTNNLDWTQPLNTNNPTFEYYPSRPGVWPRTASFLDKMYPYNLYPPAFQLPKSGKVFSFSGRLSALIDPTQADSPVDETTIPELSRPGVRPLIYPDTPTACMLPLTIANNWTATIQICGGTTMPSNATNKGCYQIRPEDDKPQWEDVDLMPAGKVMPDVVLLPNGQLFYTNGGAWGEAGGSAGEAWNSHPPSYDSFLFDPTAPAGSRFKGVASATVGRLYHSGALLVPDGRIVTTGSEMANWEDIEANRTACFPFNRTNACLNPFETRMELFSPPYLFLPGKPQFVKNPPSNITYGSTFDFTLNLNPALNLSRISMTRYGSTTHSTNTDQRYVELEVLSKNPANNRVVVRAPKNGFVAPPGRWMVWAVGTSGGVGQAFTVFLQSGAPTSVTVDQATATSSPNAAGRTWGHGKGAANAFVGMVAAVMILAVSLVL